MGVSTTEQIHINVSDTVLGENTRDAGIRVTSSHTGAKPGDAAPSHRLLFSNACIGARGNVAHAAFGANCPAATCFEPLLSEVSAGSGW